MLSITLRLCELKLPRPTLGKKKGTHLIRPCFDQNKTSTKFDVTSLSLVWIFLCESGSEAWLSQAPRVLCIHIVDVAELLRLLALSGGPLLRCLFTSERGPSADSASVTRGPVKWHCRAKGIWPPLLPHLKNLLRLFWFQHLQPFLLRYGCQQGHQYSPGWVPPGETFFYNWFQPLDLKCFFLFCK